MDRHGTGEGISFILQWKLATAGQPGWRGKNLFPERLSDLRNPVKSPDGDQEPTGQADGVMEWCIGKDFWLYSLPERRYTLRW
jgi:hypothetical protein